MRAAVGRRRLEKDDRDESPVGGRCGTGDGRDRSRRRKNNRKDESLRTGIRADTTVGRIQSGRRFERGAELRRRNNRR